jgi:hypothetical protein
MKAEACWGWLLHPRAILDYASHDEGVYHLTAEERREVCAGLAEIKRGEIASDAEVAAVYKQIGL